jgi:uncharacterized protein involved in type VI secretion and phage assembly
MNLLDILQASHNHVNGLAPCYGVVVALVTNNNDPEGLGRIKVQFPWLSEVQESHWARIASLMAGKDRGTYFLPEVDDEVLVAFEHGDLRFPYILGMLWNGKDTVPAKNEDEKNNIRMIKSRSGHTIRLDDTEGKEKIEILDKTGKNSLVFDTAQNTITIAVEQDLTLSAPKGKIELAAQTINLAAKGSIKLTAQQGMDIETRGTMNLQGSMINLN